MAAYDADPMANYTGARATDAEMTTLWVLSTLSSALSIVGSLLLIFVLLRAGLRTRMDALLVVLAGLGVISHAAFLFGQAFIPAPGAEASFMCLLQANGIQTFSISSILWTGWLSVAELLSIQSGRLPLSAPPTLPWVLLPLVPIVLFSMITSIVIQNMGGFGDATLWCWIKSSYGGWQLGFYYLPLCLAWLTSLLSILCVRREIGRRLQDAQTCGLREQPSSSGVLDSALISSQAVGSTTRYLLVFVVFYSFGMINRTTNAILESDHHVPFVFALYVLHAFFQPLQGFGNAVVHGNVLPVLAFLWRSIVELGCYAGLARFVSASMPGGRQQAALSFANEPPNELLGEPLAAAGAPIILPAPSAVHLHIFAATWNLGEQGPPSAALLASWLPSGRDVYALSLQECLHVDSFTRAALGALGGEASYTAHCHAIGSSQTALGFHGYIVILVLVRTDLERSGELSEVKVAAGAVHRGKKLLPQWLMRRQSNKGERRRPRTRPADAHTCPADAHTCT